VTEDPAESGLPRGTPILTPQGEIPVERIEPGMMLIAVSGCGAPFQTVRAVRRRRAEARCIRIRAGALAEGAPLVDLILPAGHGVFLNGGLVRAGALPIGGGILAEPSAPCDLFDIVLAAHDAVLAAGAAVETALPAPDGAPFCPRVEPDGVLLAMLAWRAEQMGWAAPPAPEDPLPEPIRLRERLITCPLRPLAAPAPIFPGSS
jgi:hypothetical protein